MAEGGNDEQVLLEAIRHDVQVIAEGHGVLLRELQETRADLQRRGIPGTGYRTPGKIGNGSSSDGARQAETLTEAIQFFNGRADIVEDALEEALLEGASRVEWNRDVPMVGKAPEMAVAAALVRFFEA